MKYWLAILSLVGALALAQSADVWVIVEDIKKLREFWGAEELATRNTKTVAEKKVAILSKGYVGLGDEMRRYLPKSTELRGEQGQVPAANAVFGRRVAQLYWAMTGYNEGGPQIRLYDASTPGGLEEAIEEIRSWKADVVLSTENLEGYGNFDGKGVLNARIDELIKMQDTIWIQSAGAYRGKVLNAPASAKDYRAKLFVRSEKTDVLVSLSWNANKRTVTGRGKDLDLYFYKSSSNGEPVEPPLYKSTLEQVTKPSDGENQTVFPFEQLLAEGLPASDTPYLIVVKRKNGDFDAQIDEMRITATSEKEPYVGDDGKIFFPVELVGAQELGQIMVPSDNQYVFTVGDMSPSSSLGAGEKIVRTVDSKPDLILDWVRPAFSDGESMVAGPHTAAAQIAAIATLMKAEQPDLSPRHFRQWVQKMRSERNANSYPIAQEKVSEEVKRLGYRVDAKEIEKEVQTDARLGMIVGRAGAEVIGVDRHLGIALGVPLADAQFLRNQDSSPRLSPSKFNFWGCVNDDGKVYIYHYTVASSKAPQSEDKSVLYCALVREIPGLSRQPRNFTKSTSLRWSTPTQSDLKTLVAQ